MSQTHSKVFVVGSNKTGTTSMGEALRSLGFRLGDQSQSELLLRDWARRDFSRIVDHCRGADAFQDIPFSLDYTYVALDQAFPGSRFILSIRSSAEEWYESLLAFHARIVGKDRLPTADDLKQFHYRVDGALWIAQQLIFGINEDTLYDRDIYIRHYRHHIAVVMDYFRFRPDDLLVLNAASSTAMESLCTFLGVAPTLEAMPHLNVSRPVLPRD